MYRSEKSFSLCREPLKNLSEADRKSRAKSLFSDYISSPDIAEAKASVEELTAPGNLHIALTAVRSSTAWSHRLRDDAVFRRHLWILPTESGLDLAFGWGSKAVKAALG